MAKPDGALTETTIDASHPEAGKMTAFCATFAAVMDLLSRRWMGVILRVLLTGPHRFSEIMSLIPGLSDPLLTQRLRELQARKLVDRRVLPTSPVRVEYELTVAGRDLEKALRQIAEWAEKWWTDPPAAGRVAVPGGNAAEHTVVGAGDAIPVERPADVV
jgi:DNA-binding HxlR family transcriptional regulator